ncbi:MAG: type II toxin-antitoxin system VapC family toxin [Phycisphaerales bacterium]
MKAVFADTSFWLALAASNDIHHQTASRLAVQLNRPIVTTVPVVIEVANALCKRGAKAEAIELRGRLAADRAARVVACTGALVQSGWKLYSERLDKDWSLTDCMSFSVMKQAGLTEALTADHHFIQAGFRALLLE